MRNRILFLVAIGLAAVFLVWQHGGESKLLAPYGHLAKGTGLCQVGGFDWEAFASPNEFLIAIKGVVPSKHGPWWRHFTQYSADGYSAVGVGGSIVVVSIPIRGVSKKSRFDRALEMFRKKFNVADMLITRRLNNAI